MRTIAKYLLIAVFLSCGKGPVDNEELVECRSDNSRLLSEITLRDSAMASITTAYAVIDSISEKISLKKTFIISLARKKKLSKADKKAILAEIDTINRLMDLNKNKVSSLQGELTQEGLAEGFKLVLQGMDDRNNLEVLQLSTMKTDLAQVSKDFNDLFEEFIYKEAENIEMKEQLSAKEQELMASEQRLEAAKEKLQSAWYVIGTKEELTSRGLIFKKGFFDNKEVNEDFDKTQFKKINIYDLKEIILDAKSAEIVTTHPSEAFEKVGMKRKVNKLVIKNPDLFWSVSKFLIIEIEK